MRVRLISAMTVLAILLAVPACSDVNVEGEGNSILVASTPIISAIVAPLLPESIRIRSVIDPGSSPHGADLQVSDVRLLTRAAAFIAASADLDGWIARDLDIQRIYFSDILAIAENPGTDEYDLEYEGTRALSGASGLSDSHFWSDPLRVAVSLPHLVDRLCEILSEHCETVRMRQVAFSAEIAALDAEVASIVGPGLQGPVISAQPFFSAFFRRYRIPELAILERVPGREPSVSEVLSIIAAAKREGVTAVVANIQLPNLAARTVADELGVPLVLLDPTGVEKEITYSDWIRENVRRLMIHEGQDS